MAGTHEIRKRRKRHGETRPPRPTRYETATAKVAMDKGGRIVIPVEMRRALNVTAGDTLDLRLEGETLHVRSQRGAVREAQAAIGKLLPKGVSLVDELLADRRRERNDE